MSDIIATAITSKKPLQQLIDTFTPIVDECRMHFNDDGIHIRAIDPATVAYADATLHRSAFEAYDSPGEVVVGANLARLKDRLSVGDPDAVVELSIDMETRMLNVELGNIDQHVRLISSDAIRQEPDPPDVETPNSLTIEGSEFSEAADVAQMVSDHMRISGEPDESRVVVSAEGDIDESTVEFDRENCIDASVPEPASSLFSLEYIQSLADPIPKDAEVTVTFGEDLPVFLDWQAAGGGLEVTQFLAPRLQKD